MSNSSVDVGITPNGQNAIITIKLGDSEGVSVNMPAVGIGSFINGLLSAAVVLVFAIGATQLSIGVPKENLTQLGSLFLKLSGDKAAGN